MGRQDLEYIRTISLLQFCRQNHRVLCRFCAHPCSNRKPVCHELALAQVASTTNVNVCCCPRFALKVQRCGLTPANSTSKFDYVFGWANLGQSVQAPDSLDMLEYCIWDGSSACRGRDILLFRIPYYSTHDVNCCKLLHTVSSSRSLGMLHMVMGDTQM